MAIAATDLMAMPGETMAVAYQGAGELAPWAATSPCCWLGSMMASRSMLEGLAAAADDRPDRVVFRAGAVVRDGLRRPAAARLVAFLVGAAGQSYAGWVPAPHALRLVE